MQVYLRHWAIARDHSQFVLYGFFAGDDRNPLGHYLSGTPPTLLRKGCGLRAESSFMEIRTLIALGLSFVASVFGVYWVSAN